MRRVVIVGARRTPFGRFGGMLARRSPVELASIAGGAALQNFDRGEVGLVVLGSVLAAGHGMNIARQVGIRLGLPIESPAYTVNQMCGSGLHAALLAAQAIRVGDVQVALAGGVESMSQAPFLLPRPPKGQPLVLEGAIDSMQRDGLIDTFSDRHMALTVEGLAQEKGISRSEQDAYASRSQSLYASALVAGRYRDEIVAVDGMGEDEHPRPGTTVESLSQLRPAFDSSGTITAGNSSGVNDGAAMAVLAEESVARRRGWPVLAELVAGVTVGCDPQRMGLGPVHAIRLLISGADLRLDEIDAVEINEAFAAQTLACVHELRLGLDDSPRINPNGGAIAVGHPLGASGARLLTHLAWRIHRKESKKAIASLCIGGGMGIAALFSDPH